jgi:predicted RecA/RadA family phage recombinase
LKGEGFFFVNPFATAVSTVHSGNPATGEITGIQAAAVKSANAVTRGKKISLKAMTLNNDKQKINDLLGNPIVIGIVVIWRRQHGLRRSSNTKTYEEFMSIQWDPHCGILSASTLMT